MTSLRSLIFAGAVLLIAPLQTFSQTVAVITPETKVGDTATITVAKEFNFDAAPPTHRHSSKNDLIFYKEELLNLPVSITPSINERAQFTVAFTPDGTYKLLGDTFTIIREGIDKTRFYNQKNDEKDEVYFAKEVKKDTQSRWAISFYKSCGHVIYVRRIADPSSVPESNKKKINDPWGPLNPHTPSGSRPAQRPRSNP